MASLSSTSLAMQILSSSVGLPHAHAWDHFLNEDSMAARSAVRPCGSTCCLRKCPSAVLEASHWPVLDLPTPS